MSIIGEKSVSLQMILPVLGVKIERVTCCGSKVNCRAMDRERQWLVS